MRIASLNCNGIRSAARKGFYDWLPQHGLDVVCLQETRCADEDVADPLYQPSGYHSEWLHAEKRGYSGVAIYSRRRPDLEARFGNLSVVSVYLPSGSSGPERQAAKFRCLAEFEAHLGKLRRSRRDVVLCGDWNIAHKPIDLKNWRSNQKNSGFTPEERAWLDLVFGKLGWVDAFRVVEPGTDQYTWWSNRGQAWAKNVGWRIDYHVVSPSLADKIRAASIWKTTRFSDHAPLILDYDHAL